MLQNLFNKLFLVSWLIVPSFIVKATEDGGVKNNTPVEVQRSSLLSKIVSNISAKPSNYVTRELSNLAAITSSEPEKQKTLERMNRSLDLFKEATSAKLSQDNSWTVKGDLKWVPNFSIFQPYTERLTLKPNDRAFMFGDFHGDVKTLGAFLQDLHSKDIIDEELKLKSPHYKLIFLGDYTDRGYWGLEVIEYALTLFEKNPGQVRLVRGNHEDLFMNRRDGFKKELDKKVPQESADSLFRSFGEFYNLMPLAIYAGNGKNWLQLCHGGLETAYLPDTLIQAPEEVHFDLVNPLYRKPFFDAFKKRYPRAQDLLRLRYRNFRFWGFEKEISYDKNLDNVDDCCYEPVYAYSLSHSDLGLAWTDFQFNVEEDFTEYSEGRGFKYTANFTKAALPILSPYLRAIVRAHQHGEDPIMDHLKTHGTFRFWENDKASEQALPIEQGNIFMLNVGADTSYWHLRGQHRISTYVELRMAEEFADWRIIRHNVELPPENEKHLAEIDKLKAKQAEQRQEEQRQREARRQEEQRQKESKRQQEEDIPSITRRASAQGPQAQKDECCVIS